jgi:hypothetical protein
MQWSRGSPPTAPIPNRMFDLFGRLLWESARRLQMNAQKYTFITVVFEAEYDLLALQGRSMQLYCPLELIDSIVVIDNSRSPISPDNKGRIIDAYGSLANFVRFLTARDVAQLPEAKGWLTQQILKLMAAKFIQTERYVILDAKNHLVCQLGREFLEAPDGRARTKMGDYRRHPLREDLVRTLDYFGVDADSYLEAFTPTVPPFVMYTDIVRKLIQQITENEKLPFEIAFIQLRFVEFFLYIGYILHNGNLNDFYDFHQISSPVIWEQTADERGCLEAITRATQLQSPFFALHRTAIAKLTKSSRSLVAEFWHRRKLFDSKESADTFILNVRRHDMLSQIRTWRQLQSLAASIEN